MDDKPTPLSITTTLCECKYLQNAADAPNNPIVFEPKTNEYHFQYWNKKEDEEFSSLVIYHCPFCGGAAPKSKRSLLFARIPGKEEARLASILTPLKSIAEAIEALGAPDFDDYCVSRYPESDDKPPETRYSRELRYYRLSTIADVYIVERPNGSVGWWLCGKQLNDQNS